MFCQKCGLKLPDGAKFCGVCGTPVPDESASGAPQTNWAVQNQMSQYGKPSQVYPFYSQPKKKKNGGKIAVITTCSLLAISIIFIGVFAIIGGLKTSFFQKPSTSNQELTVNFDLSQYEAHGELSDGLIWVERTTASYDQSPETQFAYFDTDGNQKSEWFYSSEWEKNDFANGLLCIYEKNYMKCQARLIRAHKLIV